MKILRGIVNFDVLMIISWEAYRAAEGDSISA